MIDERDLLERALHRFEPQPGLTDRVYRRRERKRRNQRIGAGALAIILALVSFVALTRAFRTTERPADEPTPRPEGIFSEVGGWIAYGDEEGIWAVNPTGPGGPEDQVQLTERGGEPLAWSSDGSKLLILRLHNWSSAVENRGLGGSLHVLNSDGTETLLVQRGLSPWMTGGSFTPGGSKVIYGANLRGEEWRPGIYVVDADGGSPRLLYAVGGRMPAPGPFSMEVFLPTLSPDGSRIAYFEGLGGSANYLWVMNADGTDKHRIWGTEGVGHVFALEWSPDGARLAFEANSGLAFEANSLYVVNADGSGLAMVDGSDPHWSPDGSRLAFCMCRPNDYPGGRSGGIGVINADGSGPRQVALGGRDPVWLPDGSRIAYLVESSLYVADLDGTNVRTLGTVEFGQRPSSAVRLWRELWNPLLLSASGGGQPTATVGGSGAAPFVYAIAVLGAVGVFVIAGRARRRTAAR
jgi:hypothetical protein